MTSASDNEGKRDQKRDQKRRDSSDACSKKILLSKSYLEHYEAVEAASDAQMNSDGARN